MRAGHLFLVLPLALSLWSCSGATADPYRRPDDKDLPDICREGGLERHRAAQAAAAQAAPPRDAGVSNEPPLQDALAPEVVRTVLNKSYKAIRSCYENEYARNPKLYGHLLVEFTIHSSGAVKEVRVVEDSLGNARVRECVTTRVRIMSFPPFAEGQKVDVSYPFLFCGYPPPVTPARTE
ncbi:MAG: AgmX/PglI C-terminal domain-containing protein [Myxococcota bacterium]